MVHVPGALNGSRSSKVEGDLSGSDGGISIVLDSQGVLLVRDSVGDPGVSRGSDRGGDGAGGSGEGEVTCPEQDCIKN